MRTWNAYGSGKTRSEALAAFADCLRSVPLTGIDQSHRENVQSAVELLIEREPEAQPLKIVVSGTVMATDVGHTQIWINPAT